MSEASKPFWLHWPPDLFEEMQERLERFYEAGRHAVRQIASMPSTDLRETPDRFIVELDLPGIDPQQCEVSVKGQTLIVRGERKLPEAGPNEHVRRCERHGGPYARELALSEEIEEAGVTANYHAGVMRVELPKRNKAKPHRVNIAAK